MRNFLQFIWNNQFTLLFILLEIVGFALLTTNNHFHNSKIQSASASLSGSFADTRNSYAQYIGLKEENEKLLDENRRLRERLEQRVRYRLDPNIPFEYTTAHAISSTFHLGNNYIVLDRGSSDGIEPQQAVLSPQGIVGVVYKVSEKYSTVLPVIHSQSRISCKLTRNNYFGLLHWDGTDDHYATLENIPNHIGVFDGDSIVTRGGSGIFPPNILVGFAEGSEKDEASGFQSVNVRLATDFRKIYNVYIVENKVRQEVDSLIQTIEE